VSAVEKDFLERLAAVNTWKRGDERAPHKPLLLLKVLSRIQRGEARLVRFSDIEYDLRRLLEEFGPSRKSYHPEFPFWHLQSDGLWEVPGNELLELKKSGKSPSPRALRDSEAEGGLPERYDGLLRKRPALIADAARRILEVHFPGSMHEDILEATGLDLGATEPAAARAQVRDPAFRAQVLMAYSNRCAVCGFYSIMDGRSYGIEAAHVKWHSHAGPSTVANGLGLCILHHKAFDRGVLGLSDDDCVLVSARFSGNEEAERHFLPLAGRELLGPQPGQPRPAPEFKRWHRKNCFRGPERGVA